MLVTERTMRRITLGTLVLLMGALSQPAQASFTIQAGQSTYATTPNGSTTVVIKLVETGGTTLADSDGLFSFGFTLTRTTGTATITAVTRNAAFDSVKTGSTLSSELPVSVYKLWAAQDVNFGVEGPGADGSGQVTLATLTINGGPTGGMFQLADFGSRFQTVLYSGDGLDPTLGFGSFTIAVPEPGSAALLLLAAIPLGLRRRRRCDSFKQANETR